VTAAPDKGDARARDRSQAARIAALTSWARTPDRTARTAAATRAWAKRFEKLVDPEGIHPPEVRAQMADAARRAFYQRMARNSARARRARA